MSKAEIKYLFNPTKENLVKILLEYGIFDFEIDTKGKEVDPTTIFIKRKVNNYILRISKPKASTEKIISEVNILNELYSKGIRVPFIFPNIKGELITKKVINNSERYCYLMEIID